MFDAAQNMQLSQGQVAAKHLHVPQPFLPQEKLRQTSQFQFSTKVWDLQGLEPLCFRMLIVVNPVWGEGFWLFNNDHFASNTCLDERPGHFLGVPPPLPFRHSFRAFVHLFDLKGSVIKFSGPT